MTNFDFLKQTLDFATFADVSISAEKLIYIGPNLFLTINKSKLAIQKSLEKLETLKISLMQKYFG